MNVVAHHEMPPWLKAVIAIAGCVALYVGWVWSLSSMTADLANGQKELSKSVVELTSQIHENTKQTQSLTVAIAEMNAHMGDFDRRVNAIERDEKERALQEWRKK